MPSSRIAEAYVQVVPRVEGVQSALSSQLSSQLAGAGEAGGDNLAKGVSGGFSGKIKSALGPAIGALGGALTVAGAVQFGKEMYTAAVEGQKVDATLTSVAKSMGIFGAESGTVVTRLQEFATAQMNLTGTDDDVIKNAQTKLLTFKDLATSADTAGGAFDRATVLSMDMATVFGGDASSQAVALGKALNDPIKGVSSLSRVGVQFTDDQKAMIKGMVEAGDTAGAQEIILKELETQVGGTAAASATSGEIMSAKWGELTQTLGTALLPAFEGVTNALTWMIDNLPILTPILAGVGAVMAGIGIYMGIMNIQAAILAAGGLPAVIASTWAWTAALLANPITWIILGVGLLVAAIVALAMNWDAVVAWIETAWQGFVDWIGGAIQWVADIFLNWTLIGIIIKYWDDIVKVFEDVWNGIVKWFGDAIQWLVDLFLNWTLLGQIIKNWDAITAAFSGAWDGIVKWFDGAIDGFVKGWESSWSGMGKFIEDTFNNIVGFVKAPLNVIIGLINNAIEGINSIKIDIPDWVPLIGGTKLGFNIPKIPKLAAGGFVDQPTTALIGEAGPEVVTPLKEFKKMVGIDGNGKGNTINYYAAPNQSIDREEALFKAMRRAKVVASW